MYTEREGHGHRRGRTLRTANSICGCSDTGRSSRSSSRYGNWTGYSREGRVNFDDPTMLYRRRGTSGGVMEGIMMGGVFGGQGGGRSPMMGNMGSLRSPMPPRIDPRQPYMSADEHGNPYGPLLGSFVNSGAGPRGGFSQNGPSHGRGPPQGPGPYMSGALPAPPLPPYLMSPRGLRSPRSSSSSSSIFDPYAFDRSRMPYGPRHSHSHHPQHHPHSPQIMHRPSNYRSPYVEDYESDLEAEMMERAMMQMNLGRGADYYGMVGGMDGMQGGPYIEDFYSYGEEMGGILGPMAYHPSYSDLGHDHHF
ncbi:hypothetical protein BGZ60DRAFT_525595 [Tricladium varicosporioides]|nr:hypothetical protein BGZ60DRAFT_525595 [Hymenoscyphus varicosporioides]